MVSLPVPDTAAGQDGLAAFRRSPRRALLAVDFDGTLAPIVPDPEQSRAHPDVLPALALLAPRIGTVAVVTGRAADTAVRLGGFADATGLDTLTVLGAYGAERWDAATGETRTPGPHAGVMAARAELPAVISACVPSGQAHIEDKGGALAVHTRRAADPQAALDALRRPLTELAARHALGVEPGRYVLELRPPGIDKGAALAELVRERDPSVVLYAGDDLGDLPAFETVRRLRADGLPGVRILSASAEVPELAAVADLTVDGPQGMAALLAALAEAA
ncbi:trehalose-phosphatase, partial [Streptomyces sp. SM12]|uniref:trehalose-phosphatase n=2 Tax=unclassified Streptomyces TaxID=2593676 RepID=UPI000CD524E1